jgi:integrase/recombinase XerD
MLNRIGCRLRGCSYWRSFKRILGRSRIEKQVSVHHLRHSIATHLLAGGMTIEQVRDFLGHECLESTQIYTRIQAEQLRL